MRTRLACATGAAPTIASLTSALASDLMPSQGSAISAGLERAAGELGADVVDDASVEQ